jgi:hypothetical protein
MVRYLALFLLAVGAANAQEGPQLPQSPEAPASVSKYDKAIFQKPVPSDHLAFLNHYAGAAANQIVRDKQFRKLVRSFTPDCVFHYGWDMPLSDALDLVLKGSTVPVRIREGRYATISGRNGPYLMGRGFLWFDLQDGIALGGFYFHPTNGEPTPSVTIFSRQVREESLGLSQLPAAFVYDLNQWSGESRIPPITTRYFITGLNKKILLEHDEDYCAPVDRTTRPPANICEPMNAEAADIDLTAAYYLAQTHHATNATAWMIAGQDQVAWLRIRENTCRAGPEPLRCRILMTRERTRAIIGRNPVPHPIYK